MDGASAGAVPARRLPAGNHICWVLGDNDDHAAAAASFLDEAGLPGRQPIVFAPSGSALISGPTGIRRKPP
jgi:hypothetical protein